MSKLHEIIEIEVRKSSPVRSPPIIKKLMKKVVEPMSQEEINQKLKKANELREEGLTRKCKINTDNKVKLVLERKENLYREHTEKVKVTLETRAEQALRKRQENLQSRINNAKKVSEKLGKVLQTKEEMEKEKESKLISELKLVEQAQQKNQEMQEQTRLKAKIHIQNVEKVVELQKEKKAKQLETKKSEILKKLDKAG